MTNTDKQPEDQAPASIGHNGLALFDPEKTSADAKLAKEKLDAAGAWLDLKEITTEEQAGKLSDFVQGVKALWKRIDEARKAEKKPFDDEGKKVQAAFTPILEKLGKAATKVEPMQTAWLTKKSAAAKEAERIALEQAQAKADAAAKALAEAEERNDISGLVDAEAALAEAGKEAKQAAKISGSGRRTASASGAGRTTSLRTYRSAEITSAAAAFVWLRDNDRVGYVAVAQEIQAQCNRLVRASGGDKISITGVTIKTEERAV